MKSRILNALAWLGVVIGLVVLPLTAHATNLGDYQVSQATQVTGTLPVWSIRVVTPAASAYSLAGFSNAGVPVAANFTIGGGLTVTGSFPNYTIAAGASSVAWGSITGTLSNQTDLNTALGGKQPLATNLTSVAGLSYASLSFVKMSAAGTFSLDTNTYLTASTGTTTVAGTAGNVLVNGATTGVSGAVTLSLPTAITGVNSVTAASSTDLTLFGGSSGAEIDLGNGATANITVSPTGTGFVEIPRSGSATQYLDLYGGDAGGIYITAVSGAGSKPLIFNASGTTVNIQFQINGAAGFEVSPNVNLLVNTSADNSNGRIQLSSSTSASAGIVFGNDSPQASIYRSAASTLTSPANWVFSGTSVNYTGLIQTVQSAQANTVWESQVTGDSAWRLQLAASGSFNWGGGSSAPDVTLFRSSAGQVSLTGELVLSGTAIASANLNVFDAGSSSIGGAYRMMNSSNTNEWRWGFRNTGATLGTGLYFSVYNGSTWTAAPQFNQDGSFSVTTAVASSSTGTGSIVDAGGLGVAGATYIGGILSVTGHVTLEGVTSTGATGTNLLVFATSPAITTPVISSGLTATGSGANDFSGSTGTFLTSTGNNTIGGAATFNSTATHGGTALNAGALPSGATTTGSVATYAAQTTTVTGTNTATAYQEIYHGVFTVTDASVGTVTDLFNEDWVGPATVAASAAATRKHTLGILDSTSAASSITGALVVATTYGTSATSVGIGGGNINAGGTITAGGAGSFGATTIAGAAATTALTITQTARTSGVLPYIKWTIPTDTAQTASTESPGLQVVTGTRTWATTGTVALQREIFFAGPTYASASASQTFTDAFNVYMTPPVAGSNAIFTRGHTLGIVDATSAASAITGGLVVATTLGTAATSVGIGGGNVNAGGTIISGGQITSGAGITTAAGVTNAAGVWKLGALRSSTALVTSTTTVIQIDVGGTLYSLMTCTTNP